MFMLWFYNNKKLVHISFILLNKLVTHIMRIKTKLQQY